tara:strand:- start:1849 stop:2079 length:231 start_codon:yes stop_codon:yes gene_type:complete
MYQGESKQKAKPHNLSGKINEESKPKPPPHSSTTLVDPSQAANKQPPSQNIDTGSIKTQSIYTHCPSRRELTYGID